MVKIADTDVVAENFRLNIRKLEDACLIAGVKADFSHILAATDSDEGLKHRREIMTHILQAKHMEVRPSDLDACKDISRFMTFIATLTEITRAQEFREAAALPPGVTPGQAEAVKSVQSYLSAGGSSFRIDLAKTFGDGADPAYQVSVHDEMVASYGADDFRPTQPENVPSHPVFSNQAKLLETMNLFIVAVRYN